METAGSRKTLGERFRSPEQQLAEIDISGRDKSARQVGMEGFRKPPADTSLLREVGDGVRSEEAFNVPFSEQGRDALHDSPIAEHKSRRKGRDGQSPPSTCKLLKANSGACSYLERPGA